MTTTIDYSKLIWDTISNLAFLLPAGYSALVGMYVEAVAMLAIVVFSSAYHACFELESCMIQDKTFSQVLDFAFAFNSIFVIMVHVLNIQPTNIRSALNVALLIVSFIISDVARFNSTAIIITYAVVAGILLFHQLWHLFFNLAVRRSKFFANMVEERNHRVLNVVDIIFGFIGILVFVGGFLCQYFANQDGGVNYWFLHPIWHVCDAVAALFFFKMRNPFVTFNMLVYKAKGLINSSMLPKLLNLMKQKFLAIRGGNSVAKTELSVYGTDVQPKQDHHQQQQTQTQVDNNIPDQDGMVVISLDQDQM